MYMHALQIKFNSVPLLQHVLENSGKMWSELGSYFQGDSLSSILQEHKCLPQQEGEVRYAQ